MRIKKYELDSRNSNIPLNKTAGRFYFEKFINEFKQDKIYYKKLFGYSEITDNDKKEIFKKFVCIVNLETNSYCNRSCEYCPLSIFDRKNKTPKKYPLEVSINNELFSKILEELQEINYQSTISLNLYNEPLSDIYLFKRVEEIKQKLPKVFLRFNSNGDLLDYKSLQTLSKSGLDSINITLHTLKNEIYDDEKSRLKIEHFYKKLRLNPPHLEINQNKNITSSLYVNSLLLIVNTSNWSIFGNDRGGG